MILCRLWRDVLLLSLLSGLSGWSALDRGFLIAA